MLKCAISYIGACALSFKGTVPIFFLLLPCSFFSAFSGFSVLFTLYTLFDDLKKVLIFVNGKHWKWNLDQVQVYWPLLQKINPKLLSKKKIKNITGYRKLLDSLLVRVSGLYGILYTLDIRPNFFPHEFRSESTVWKRHVAALRRGTTMAAGEPWKHLVFTSAIKSSQFTYSYSNTNVFPTIDTYLFFNFPFPSVHPQYYSPVCKSHWQAACKMNMYVSSRNNRVVSMAKGELSVCPIHYSHNIYFPGACDSQSRY